LPLNVNNKWDLNGNINFTKGLTENSILRVDVDKLLFGFKWLSIRIPCFMGYFGSCSFNVCEMFRLHWDEQFCGYMLSEYNMSCKCPEILSYGVFRMKDLHYAPKVDRIVKYMSWFASVFELNFFDFLKKANFSSDLFY
jgi:hypothetical protein